MNSYVIVDRNAWLGLSVILQVADIKGIKMCHFMIWKKEKRQMAFFGVGTWC